MDTDLQIKLAAYHYFAEAARRPTADEVAERANATIPEVLAAYQRLRAQRVLLLEPDGESIRMAPPFSCVPTQHTAVVGGKSYFADCASPPFAFPPARATIPALTSEPP